MGKGYNNYMCKKPFHPGSKANIKRAWMAEQKTENEKRKQEELKTQYEKEQDLYNNRVLISSESKDKLELNFMYEAPPGAKRERQKEDDEPEFKFEWQRKYNAPREDYAKGNEDIKDQPFGIPVRNVRCIKCHKWGHINTDKECPLYNQASTTSMPTTSMDPLELMRQMKEDGFGLKENVLGHQLNPAAANQQFIPSDEESDPEIDFLKSLSSAEKKKLLKKLKKLSKKQKSSNCKKKKKSKKAKKKSRASISSDSEKEKRSKKKKSKKSSSSSDSDSSSSEDSEKRPTKKSKDFEYKDKKSNKANLHDPSVDAKRNSKHQYQQKFFEEMSAENLNHKRNASKEDLVHKKGQNEPRQELPGYSKCKTMETKKNSREKYSKEASEDSGRSSKKHNSHKIARGDYKKESSEHGRHENKVAKHEEHTVDSRTKKKEKQSSSSDERKYQTSKTDINSHERKSELSSNKEDTHLSKYTSKENIIHKKLISEPSENPPDCNKHKSKKDSENTETEKKGMPSHSNSEQVLETETFSDEGESSKRKHGTSVSEDNSNITHVKKRKYDHPDGFSHLCPQAHIKANYLQPSKEYEGNVHDKFRHHYRDIRSPSVKQKYNK